MTSSSDFKRRALLVVPQVIFKKGPSGTLYVLADQIVWVSDATTTNNGSLATVSATFDEIKVQKISPEAKEKVQLQLCLHNGQCITLQFVNDIGRFKQFEDREHVKNLVQQKLLLAKVELNDEFQRKEKILKENSQLFTLYNELVVCHRIISAEEFWNNYAKQELDKLDNQVPGTSNQAVGVSSGFLSDVAQTDGCNGIKLTLTADIITSIFRTYPSVEKRYMELVPKEVSEEDFWTMFFSSQYFHRDRKDNLKTSPFQLFADCIKLDNEDLQSQLNKLTNHKRTMQEIEDDRGLAVLDPEDDASVTKNQNNKTTNADLIRKFNYRSGQVLKACLGEDYSIGSESNGSVSIGSLLPSISRDSQGRLLSKRTKFADSEELTSDSTNSNSRSTTLKLSNSDNYQLSSAFQLSQDISCNDIASRQNSENLVKWKAFLVDYLNQPIISEYSEQQLEYGDGAFDFLMEFSASNNEAFKSNLNEKSFEELKTLYVTCEALLKQFWSCFPTTTPEADQKLLKTLETLKKFDEKCLRHLTACSDGNDAAMSTNAIGRLRTMVDTAYAKFDGWSQRKAS